REAVAGGKVVPIYFASGVRPSGIAALLDGIVELVPPPNAHAAFHGSVPGAKTETAAERPSTSDAPAAAFVFKTSIDPHAGRTSFVRVLSGTLKSDQTLLNSVTLNTERVGKINLVVSKDGKPVDEAKAGDIVALAKLKATRSGQTLSDEKQS